MTTGVPIVTAATAVQLTAGDMIYLISSAALWFGDQMEISLFNGNIVWELCTNPYDPHRDLIMHDQGWGLVILLQDTGKGRNKTNDNPANSAQGEKNLIGGMYPHTYDKYAD